MKRSKVSCYFLAFGVVVLTLFSTTYAACETCDAAPEGLETYIEVIETLLAAYPVVDESISGTGVNLAGKIAQKATVQTSALQQILAPYPTYNVYGSTRMVYKDESTRRDRQRLGLLQEKIIDRTLALVNSENHLKEMPLATIQLLDTQLKKLGYVELVKNGSSYELAVDKATYEILARLVRQFHILYEELHKQDWFHNELFAVGEGVEKTNTVDVEQAIKEMEHERLSRAFASAWQIVQISFGPSAYERANDVNLLQYIDFPFFGAPFMGFVWQMQESYECSVGLARNECREGRQETRKDTLETFKERIVNDSSRAKNTFLESRSRLKGVFKKGSTADGAASRQREEALLNSYRGSDVPSKDAWRDLVNVESQIDPFPTAPATAWKAVSRSMKSMGNTLGNTSTLRRNIAQGNVDGREVLGMLPFVSLSRSVTIDTNPISPNQEDANSYETLDAKVARLTESEVTKRMLEYDKEVQRFFGNFEKDETTNLKEQSIQQSMYSVLQLQQDIQAKVLFNDVKRTTQKFPLLSASVYNNMTLLGKKNPVNESEGGWYAAMSTVCDLQCSNLEGKICQHIGN